MKPPGQERTNETYLFDRRKMLVLLGTTAAASVVGCSKLSTSYTPRTIAGCLVSPEQTEGPYFIDERLNRSDIRIDPTDGSVVLGMPLRLALSVYQVTNDSCTPLPNATVDVWHCNALV